MTRAVEDVLEEIGAGDQPRILVLNKADAIDDERRARARLPPSRRRARVGADRRGPRRAGRADRRRVRAHAAGRRAAVPFSEGGTLSELHDFAGDLEREETPAGVRVSARLPAVVAERFDRYAVDGAQRPIRPDEPKPRSPRSSSGSASTTPQLRRPVRHEEQLGDPVARPDRGTAPRRVVEDDPDLAAVVRVDQARAR